MAFSLGDGEDTGMSEMNLIPLIDIMLVLMIIFLVTATVLNPSVALSLPDTVAQVSEMPPEVIQVSIDKDGVIYWDKEQLSLDELSVRMKERAAGEKSPSVHLRADKEAVYDTVAKVLAVSSEAGLTNIAFVSD